MSRQSSATTATHPLNDRQDAVEHVLRRLEIDVRMRLDGMLHGDYRGLVPGHGSEPGEARLYAPGDDVRRIDWNVTARLQSPHIRQSIAERELETVVGVDLSPSLDFGTAQCEKRDLVVAAVAALGLLTGRVGNRFGAELIRPSGIETVPARQGRDHALAIVRSLLTEPRAEEGSTDLAAGIAALGSSNRRRGLRVIISDFLSSDGWSHELRRLSARHETLAIEIIDPREMELPNVGNMMVVDPRSGRRRRVNTSRSDFRERYAAAAAQQRAEIAASIRDAGTDHLILRTDRDWLLDTVAFVAARRRRNDARPARAASR